MVTGASGIEAEFWRSRVVGWTSGRGHSSLQRYLTRVVIQLSIRILGLGKIFSAGVRAERVQHGRGAGGADRCRSCWQGYAPAACCTSSPTIAQHTSLARTSWRSRRGCGLPRKSNSKLRFPGCARIQKYPPRPARTRPPGQRRSRGAETRGHASNEVSSGAASYKRGDWERKAEKGADPWEEFRLRPKKNR